MKKALILFILLFIPFIVKAEIKITDVELVDSSDKLELEDPTFEDLKLNLNINFNDKDEFAKYKITIKNDTNKSYEVSLGEEFSKSDYIKYEFENDIKDNVLLSDSEGIFYITVTYNEEVPITEFTSRVFKENNALHIDFTEIDQMVNASNMEQMVNPSTKIGSYILLYIILAVISLIVILLLKKKMYTMIVLLLFLIPFTIYALEKKTIEISTTIEIEREEQRTQVDYCSYYDEDDKYHNANYTNITFLTGMSWNDYIDGKYGDPEVKGAFKASYGDIYLIRRDELEECLETENYETCSELYVSEVSYTDEIISVGQEENGYYRIGDCK